MRELWNAFLNLLVGLILIGVAAYVTYELFGDCL